MRKFLLFTCLFIGCGSIDIEVAKKECSLLYEKAFGLNINDVYRTQAKSCLENAKVCVNTPNSFTFNKALDECRYDGLIDLKTWSILNDLVYGLGK